MLVSLDESVRTHTTVEFQEQVEAQLGAAATAGRPDLCALDVISLRLLWFSPPPQRVLWVLRLPPTMQRLAFEGISRIRHTKLA